MEALAETVERLERAWLPAELVPHHEFYPYDPTPVSVFTRALELALLHRTGDRYLEVGCGIGTKLIIAAKCGLLVHGIEAREQYVAMARHLCPEATIETADARTWQGYRDFDIVFSYKPLISEEGNLAYEAHLTEWMRPGAILINPWRPMYDFGWRPLVDNRPHVWIR